MWKVWIALAVVCSICAVAQRPKDARTNIVGTWRLTTRTVVQNGQKVTDAGLGELPLGFLVYDGSGHVFAQLMRPNRATTADCAPAVAPANNSATINGYDAYFGTYTIRGDTVTHHLEGALSASDVGKDLTRHFKIFGDTLTISFVTETPTGKQERTVKWERVR